MKMQVEIRPISLVSLFLATGILALAASPSVASEIKLVANSSIQTDTLSSAEIKRVFLLESTLLANGKHVEPVLKKSGPTHDAFLKEFLDTTDYKLRLYYGTLIFSGKGSLPKELESDADVVAYVARTKGALGYVSAEASTEGVRTIAVEHPGGAGSRKLISRVEPAYPQSLKALGIGGTVKLQVTISPQGHVEEVEVLGGNPILAESATAAVKLWLYAPARSQKSFELSIPFIAHP